MVEDDADMLDVIATKLRRDGYEVYEASSGESALGLLAMMHHDGWPSDDIDLLILDVHLPGRSGVNVLRDLRKKRSTIPVLIITGSAEPGLVTTATCLGARVMIKPLSLDRLSDVVIRSILAREREPAR